MIAIVVFLGTIVVYSIARHLENPRKFRNSLISEVCQEQAEYKKRKQ